MIAFFRVFRSRTQQEVARDIRIVEARGSTPLCSTKQKPLKLLDFKGFVLLLKYQIM